MNASRRFRALAPALLAGPLLVSVCGCEDDGADAIRRARAARAAAAASAHAASSAAPGAVASNIRALAERLDDAGAVDPPPKGGDLAADIEAFTTLDACVVARKIDDAVLGDAFLALGYDGFIKDACRVLQAAKQKRREICREVTVSTLQRHCELVVAVVMQDPEQCPKELIGRARDATCLALATHDRRLCAGVEEAERPRCEAMLAGDPKRCVSAGRAARATCERDAERWRALVGSAPGGDRNGSGGPLAAPGGSFRIEAKGAAPLRGKGEGDLAFELRRGVVLVEERGATTVRRIEIGSLGESLSLLPSVDPVLRVGIEWPVATDAKAKSPDAPRVRKLEMLVPGGGTYVSPPTKSELVVTTKKLEPQRGGGVELAVDGTVGEGDRVYGVHLEARTFVRDVVVTSALPVPVPEPGRVGVKPR